MQEERNKQMSAKQKTKAQLKRQREEERRALKLERESRIQVVDVCSRS